MGEEIDPESADSSTSDQLTVVEFNTLEAVA